MQHASILSIRVISKSSQNKVMFLEDNSARVYTTEAPEKGRANAMAVKLLSQSLDIPQSNIKIIQGIRSNNKTVKILRLAP